VTRIRLEQREPGGDLRDLFQWLDESPGGPPAECEPDLDVFETPTTVEVIVDLPGVSSGAIRVAWARGVLVIAGQKLPGGCDHRGVAFHLVERHFGRFARVLRLAGALDAGRAQATLRAGELHIVLPRIEDRRGQEIAVPVRVE
jgi:HSP20 family protein